MPCSTQLPTPQSSIQLPVENGGHDLAEDMLLMLPPNAIEGTHSPPTSPSIGSGDDKDPEYQPLSAKTTSLKSATKRRQTPSNKKDHNTILLQLPPVRARKIIEMKARPNSTFQLPTSLAASTRRPTVKPRTTSNSTTESRKTSRKTAHSLIERRRRGKMNDEFDVLKDMIPACKAPRHGEGGREMHKLEILKASVEYIRYLKDCVSQLQGDDEKSCCAALKMDMDKKGGKECEDEVDREGNMDIEMEKGQTKSEHVTTQKLQEEAKENGDKDMDVPIESQHMHFNSPPTPRPSPAILPVVKDRDFNIEAVTSPPSRKNDLSPSFDERHFTFLSSQSPSSSTWRTSLSSQIRPVMAPLPSQENDATVALMMLNGEWPSRGRMGPRDECFSRRFGDGNRGRRGLSVKDLLRS